MARRSDSTTNGASTPAADSPAVMPGCSGPAANRTDREPAIATAAPAIEAGSTPADAVACRTAAPRASATLSGPEETGFPLPAVPSPRQRPVESTTTARVDEPPASTATSSTGQKIRCLDRRLFDALRPRHVVIVARPWHLRLRRIGHVLPRSTDPPRRDLRRHMGTRPCQPGGRPPILVGEARHPLVQQPTSCRVPRCRPPSPRGHPAALAGPQDVTGPLPGRSGSPAEQWPPWSTHGWAARA